MIALEINNQTSKRIHYSKLRKATNITARELKLKKKYTASLAFVTDRQIKKLNRMYRKKDKPTDVLSFNGEADYLGEIIIAVAVAEKQAKKIGHSFHCELQFLLVHGLLHLSGFEHKTVKGGLEMEEMQNKIISKLC